MRGAPARDRPTPGDEVTRGTNVGRGAQLLGRLYARLDALEWLGRLVIRLSLGLEFFGSGLGKLGKLPGFVEYFRSLGIPAPALQAPFVASLELVCGVLVLVGLATRPGASRPLEPPFAILCHGTNY